MPTRWETFPVEITGGLVSNLPEVQQGLNMPGSARLLLNFEPSIEGGYVRIEGYTKWDDAQVTGSAANIQGVGLLDGEVIACADDGGVYTSTGSGWTSQASGRTHSNKYRFTRINLDGTRKIIGVDGSNYPFSWDGTNFTVINGSADINGTSHVIEFKDHVFYAAGDLVTFSIPFDETDFTVADGAGNFRMPNDVTGMIVFREQLFIFTESEIKQLSGNSVSDFRLVSVADDIGCVEEDTIQEVAGDIAFMGPDGIRLLGATDRIGDFSNMVSSRNIEEEFQTFSNDYSTFSSVVIPSKSQYRIYGYTGSLDRENTIGFIGTQFESQNPMSFAWSKVEGVKMKTVAHQYYLNSEYIVFANEDGYVYRLENGATDFDGTAIKAYFWTPFIFFSEPLKRKTLYKADLYITPTGDFSGTMNLQFDFGDPDQIQPKTIDLSFTGGGTDYGTGTYGTSNYATLPQALQKKNLVGSGFNCSFKFEFVEGGSPFKLDTILVQYALEDRQ